MIYTFGCSTTKWVWPTWADWLSAYGHEVTNLAYRGYSNQNIYWAIMDRIQTFTPEDHIIIIWTQNHRINLWYDQTWIHEKDCLGFFPDTEGKLWYTQDDPYLGMYRTHPDYQTSFTHMVIDQFQPILQTQLLLDRIGCKYTMLFAINPWSDCRPVFKPQYKIQNWDNRQGLTKEETAHAKKIININPIRNLLGEINWDKFIDAPGDPLNPKDYTGLCEYFFTKKEFVILKHSVDHHPNPLAHHDYLLEKILKQDPKQGKYRDLAEKMSIESMDMEIPEFTQDDYVAPPTAKLLAQHFEEIFANL